MNNRASLIVFKIILTICFFGLLTSVHAAEGRPVAVVENNSYDFGAQFEGAEIIHDYIIKNNGDADLEILSVKSGWGCTAVSFDRLISPGAEGKITVKFGTKGYPGKTNKTIKVNTADPENAQIKLKLTGEVKKFVTIIPKKVTLKGALGEKISQTVTIIPNSDDPFKIIKVVALKGTDFKYWLEEPEQFLEKTYKLTVENTRETSGRYTDSISIITDATEVPPLSIMVSGDIQ